MKKLVLGAAAAAMTLVSGAAVAQPYGYRGDRHYYRDSDGDGRPDYREWNRDRDRDGRPDQWDRYDKRRYRDYDRYGYYDRYGHYGRYRYYGPGYGYDGYRGRWRHGQRYPYYRDDGYVIYDYGAYGLPPPRSGYRYYRSDNGDVIMAAIASGIIGLIIGQALDDDDHRHRRHRW